MAAKKQKKRTSARAGKKSKINENEFSIDRLKQFFSPGKIFQKDEKLENPLIWLFVAVLISIAITAYWHSVPNTSGRIPTFYGGQVPDFYYAPVEAVFALASQPYILGLFSYEFIFSFLNAGWLEFFTLFLFMFVLLNSIPVVSIFTAIRILGGKATLNSVFLSYFRAVSLFFAILIFLVFISVLFSKFIPLNGAPAFVLFFSMIFWPFAGYLAGLKKLLDRFSLKGKLRVAAYLISILVFFILLTLISSQLSRFGVLSGLMPILFFSFPIIFGFIFTYLSMRMLGEFSKLRAIGGILLITIVFCASILAIITYSDFRGIPNPNMLLDEVNISIQNGTFSESYSFKNPSARFSLTLPKGFEPEGFLFSGRREISENNSYSRKFGEKYPSYYGSMIANARSHIFDCNLSDVASEFNARNITLSDENYGLLKNISTDYSNATRSYPHKYLLIKNSNGVNYLIGTNKENASVFLYKNETAVGFTFGSNVGLLEDYDGSDNWCYRFGKTFLAPYGESNAAMSSFNYPDSRGCIIGGISSENGFYTSMFGRCSKNLAYFGISKGAGSDKVLEETARTIKCT